MLNINYFQHVPFEGLGSIAAWAQAAGHAVSSTKLYAGESPPPPGQLDWLIVMGGPMGTGDTEHFPWLKEEKNFIAQVINRGKTVLGICLGAQLIADVLGASVYPNPEKEIGWFPVYSTPEAKKLPIAKHLPEGFSVFHWHGDTFDLPKGAKHLMSSHACENQAFMVGNRVLGLQFHLETTQESAASLVKHCADDLLPGPFVQEAGSIIREKRFFQQLNQSMESILEYLAGVPT